MRKYLKIAIPAFLSALFVAGIYGLRAFRSEEAPSETQVVLKNQERVEENLQTSIPEEFPDSFPVYPNSQVRDSWISQEDSILGMSVVWISDDSIDDISSFFKDAFSESDWRYQEIDSTEESFTLTVEKEEISGFVGVTKEDDQSMISVTLGVEN